MQISDLQRNRGNPELNTSLFRNAFEMDLKINKDKYRGRLIPINPQLSDKYTGDYYGLLIELGIPEEMHWFNMRLNDWLTTTDYIPNKPFIFDIDASAVKTLLEYHLASQRQL